MSMRFYLHVLLCAALLLTASASANAEQLFYGWKPDQKFSYQMEILVDTDDEKVTYKGVFHYTVNSVRGNQATIGYNGGLSESKTIHSTGSPRFGFPAFPPPFSRPNFRGIVPSANTITITTEGQVLALEGDSQLPYLLGHASLIPFESLHGSDKNKWSSDSGVSITKTDDNAQHPFNRFGPMGPFGPFGAKEIESFQAASELSTYSVKGTKGDLVTIKKTYRLHTPDTTDNASFDMSGDGTWTFDEKEKLPHACDMKFELAVKVKNTTTTIPMTVKYNRVSAEELAQMEADAKKQMEKLAQAAADAKRISETPLTETEKQEALAALASSDAVKIQAMLNQLAQKSLKDPSPEIAAAIKDHLQSSNPSVASVAELAMGKWSRQYATLKKVEREYQGPAPVESTGLIVESSTPLYVGQLVQARRRNRGSFWYAAKVKELLSNGQVQLQFLTFGKEHDADSESAPRNNIQLAPPELPQIEKPAAIAMDGSAAQVRTWSDMTGKFKIDAVFVNVVAGKVNLLRNDGKTMSIDIEKLCKADQEHIESLVKQQQLEDENPFKLTEP